MIDDDFLIKKAKHALERPDDFGWWGEDDMFSTWGFTGLTYIKNSGDILNESNWYVISEDLMTRFPDDFRICGINHWVVGSTDQLTVRVLFEEGDVTVSNITPAFRAAIDWADALENYFVADDSDFSERQYEQQIKDVVWFLDRNEWELMAFIEDIEEVACNLISDLCLEYEQEPDEEECFMYFYDRALMRFEYVTEWEDLADKYGKTIVWNHNTDLGGKYQQIPGQIQIDFNDETVH